ncbi:histidine kinase [Slackia exigua]|uniref:ATPase/histidine kinase/DNA gyrase B/HSP90 domain protein n=1 Tax=Slackia exigua (strain ATCC 700122 / DSM 15923 / CIP 105133 / JCM 11022 / KCTC 5966 / S-7) TaxID=649764 RepID=D0WHA5_SLAES|nr:histidine kinase [Slackia exigua]MDU5612315.1 histidine kinase [Slackia sp.]EEZ61069.1 ATPase/histidine kinase/DNA gyrase B/HSP90 domain protein [Slackia exigua ATCC 700122]MCK6138498.1 histidine kinase [Slackia exigua]MCQ5091017.1 histidine kinase [Slackia exigua]MDK7723465.1 histidine kinase [Slackia exigua]
MPQKDTYERVLDVVLLATLLLSGGTLVYSIYSPAQVGSFTPIAGTSFTLCLLILVYMRSNPDTIRAQQSDTILRIASQTLECLQNGVTIESAQRICRLLLPATSARAVAITDREHILGYSGDQEISNPGGSPIRTKATHATLKDGKTRVLSTPEAIGFPSSVKNLRAGIIVPLRRGEAIVGTLKLYFRRARNINETQLALAEGLGELLSTQIAAVELDQQVKLATAMELRALQSQINPHFLFNTINTIASLTRTDPDRARVLLREFAVFYRRTLEDAQDMIELDREMDQTQRYFAFELARFGGDRLNLQVEVEPGLEDFLVPAFLIQPLVENAVKHAMPDQGMLHIVVRAESDGDDAIISVSDDGVGMEPEQSRKLEQSPESRGTGIAMKNITERLRVFFGTESYMEVSSRIGEGTVVRLVLKGMLNDG